MTESLHEQTKEITELIIKARDNARLETQFEPTPELTKKINWPVSTTIGPGLEGAIACESKIGFVNGSKGWLIYQGYDIFDLCAYSTYEEVSYLLLNGHLPNQEQLSQFKSKLNSYRTLPLTKRLLMSFPIERMSPMAALRLGTELVRQNQVSKNPQEADMHHIYNMTMIASDEDSIAMETKPIGHEKAIYEFSANLSGSEELEDCFKLIAAAPGILGTIARLREGYLPLEPDPELSHAANLMYVLTGKKPNPIEERIMDICLILHADHGMNASTFASMVVASTLSDIYFSVGAGIAALSGPLHGGANEQVVKMLDEIGSIENVVPWFEKQQAEGKRIMGMGHRVYKAYDPRARVLGPLAELAVKNNPASANKYQIAKELENTCSHLGETKSIFPNVDFYSGIVYNTLGIKPELYTPIFAVARMAGWTARVLEYLQHNRIFRPRAIYTGEFDNKYVPIEKRT